MDIKCIGTGSKGNCYCLKDSNGKMLLLDVGMPEKDIKVAIGFDVANIVGCLSTHRHQDHCSSAIKLRRMGLNMYEPYNIFDGNFPQTEKKQFGDFKVTSFALMDMENEHWCHTNSDSTECPIYGFLIQHKEIDGCLIYITDCSYVKFNFKKLKPSSIILGVDYQDDLLDESQMKYEHQVTGHMSIDTACDFVNANKTECLRNVILGHLSTSSSDNEHFIEEMVTRANIEPKIAHKGMELNLSLPF